MLERDICVSSITSVCIIERWSPRISQAAGLVKKMTQNLNLTMHSLRNG